MDKDVNELYELLKQVKVSNKNIDIIKDINQDIQNQKFSEALKKLKEYTNYKGVKQEEVKDGLEEIEQEKFDDTETEFDDLDEEETRNEENIEEENTEEGQNGEIYPKKLRNPKLEKDFIGMLISSPETIAKYYILYEDFYMENKIYQEIYKGILFTEGEAYAPDRAKRNFNFGKSTYEINKTKEKLKEQYENKKLNMEKLYVEIKKLFYLRKSYLEMPIKNIQTSIVDIIDYKLYHKMSEEEVMQAINQVTVTSKFKQSILNNDLTDFLLNGDNNLTNGLNMPFPIINDVFKGMRKGETMAFAMPSNAGKSRFTINLSSYVAFVHKKKVLVISNEMSEEKMKLCLITTILNNKAYQDMTGQKIKKTEGELLEFKFRPDNKKDAEVDKDGFVIKNSDETQKEFVDRLKKISEEFRNTIYVTDWVKKQMKNSIYFANITDHTNDELKKIIMNYYYKEEIQYIFYDTLKTDTENIGNSEEIKKTATILSNVAQNFGIFICSTLQLNENSTPPINLTINDLAVSKTVKEVLDTLCLIKQITRENLDKYEYSEKEVDTKFYELEKFEDPDVRYYACVVDKNRAGAKPKVLFRLNLAYNIWEELGYLRLKQQD